jgi:uncharacterized protein (DUF58 family)
MLKHLLHAWDRTSFYLDKKVFYSGVWDCGAFCAFFLCTGTQQPGCVSVAGITDFGGCRQLSVVSYKGLMSERVLQDRFSNGDENKVQLMFRNRYPFRISVEVIDELPFQFQERTGKRELSIEGNSEAELHYFVTPQERGDYRFGKINAFVQGPLQVVSRRYQLGEAQSVKVYPSFVQLRKYTLLGVANRLQETGVKRMRKLGHSLEFEQIKEYVRGDDYRTINWKATARKGELMVNNFTDERSQQIYCLVNKGRVMKMPFGGMTLLDYAINASLVLSGVALQKQDKAGLICYGQNVDAFLPLIKNQRKSIPFLKRCIASRRPFRKRIPKSCFRWFATALHTAACW